MSLVLAVLGCLLVIEGLPYLLFPSKVRRWSAALQEARDAPMRAVGLISVFSGLLLLLAMIIL